MEKDVQKICLNPTCKKPILKLSHYGKRQKVGKGKDHIYTVPCRSCRSVIVRNTGIPSAAEKW